jgi:hypothetical protein
MGQHPQRYQGDHSEDGSEKNIDNPYMRCHTGAYFKYKPTGRYCPLPAALHWVFGDCLMANDNGR